MAVQCAGAEHFGIDGAVVGQIGIRVRHFIAPGFRTVNTLVRHNQRIQAHIRIHVRQLQQLCFGQRGHGITGHGVCCIGIHVRIVGLAGDVEPQRGGRILVRSAERAVFEHVRQACIVGHAGLECQLESAVVVVVCDIQQFRAGLLMLKQHKIRADQPELADFLYLKAFDNVAGCGQGVRVLRFQRVRERGQAAQRHRKGHQQCQQFFHVSLPPDSVFPVMRIILAQPAGIFNQFFPLPDTGIYSNCAAYSWW